MRFRRDYLDDDLEINLVPLIDVLLVILIFLAATTSFTRLHQMQVSLPEAAFQAQDIDASLVMAISSEGQYALNEQLLSGSDPQQMADALRELSRGSPEAVLLIHADSQARHEAVVRVMDAARLAGIYRIHFATRRAP